jgi:geranylgeranyl pyrophosphate synthase
MEPVQHLDKATPEAIQLEVLAPKIQALIKQYGQTSYDLAKSSITHDASLTQPLGEIVRYLIEECWVNRQHPALVSLACEAVGGNPDCCKAIGAALVLLTGAADMHDDIIDQSRVKSGKLTAFGKFGSDLTLLAGDVIILKAATQLSIACEPSSSSIRNRIIGLVDAGFSELAVAMAQERLFKGSTEVNPEEYRKIIQAKGAVSEVCTEIGALLGDGKEAEIRALGHFGRAMGVLMTLRHEFEDLRNPQELSSRFRYEILPLPVFYAFNDGATKRKVLDLLKGRLTVHKTRLFAELVEESEQVKALKREMEAMVLAEKAGLQIIKCNKDKFRLLIDLSLADL